MAKFLLLLVMTACHIMPGAEGYQPLGIGLGSSIYEVSGGYQNVKLLALNYKPLPPYCVLDKEPVLTSEQFATFNKVLLEEMVQIRAQQLRPELAPKTYDQLMASRRTQGGVEVLWQYMLRDPKTTREFEVYFDSRTGIVFRIRARIVSYPEDVPDAEAAFQAMAAGFGRTTSDGKVALTGTVNPGQFQNQVTKRMTSDEVGDLTHKFLSATSNRNPFSIENANPGGAKNPAGEMHGTLSGNSHSAFINIELFSGAQPQVEFNKQVDDLAKQVNLEADKKAEGTRKKGSTGGF